MPIQFLLFLFLLTLLFFISRKIINSLYLLLYLIIPSRELTIRLLMIILLPGTIVHELSHFLTAAILFVPAGKLSVIPKIEEGGEVRAGRVEIGKVDPFRQTFIGFAPIVIGLIIIYIAGKLVLVNSTTFSLQQLLLKTDNRPALPAGGQLITLFAIFYLLSVVSTSMFSSKRDLKPLIFAGPVIILFLISLYFVGVRIFFEEKLIISINKVISELNLFLFVTNVLDYLVFLFITLNLSFWQKILRRKIVT